MNNRQRKAMFAHLARRIIKPKKKTFEISGNINTPTGFGTVGISAKYKTESTEVDEEE